MTDEPTLKECAYGTDATLWVGKSGIESVAGELTADLDERVGTKLVGIRGNIVTSH